MREKYVKGIEEREREKITIDAERSRIVPPPACVTSIINSINFYSTSFSKFNSTNWQVQRRLMLD
jgi:hypothetical protein